MAAKFKNQNVSFALSDEMREQINQIMGSLNKYIYGLDSSQFSRDAIDHCHMQAHYQPAPPILRMTEVLQTFKTSYTQPIAHTNFECISKTLLKKIRDLQQKRIATHYELCRIDGVEIIPYDHFWEQVLLDMNLKASNALFSPIENTNIKNVQYEPFCNLINFQLISIQDSGVGVSPKSFLYLPNEDLILATFSVKKGNTFKVFTTDPIIKISKACKQFVKNKPQFNDAYDAMTTHTHVFKFHALDDCSFYRFDSRQFYIVRKQPDYSNE